jgi:Ca2+-binding EF-hand superfamily protein
MSMAISGIAGSYAPQAMSGASPRMPPAQRMATVFSQIDTSRSGSINQSQFTQAFQTMKPTPGFLAMGASAVFQALDPSNSGTVSKQAFVQGMTQLMAQFRSGGTSGS